MATTQVVAHRAMHPEQGCRALHPGLDRSACTLCPSLVQSDVRRGHGMDHALMFPVHLGVEAAWQAQCRDDRAEDAPVKGRPSAGTPSVTPRLVCCYSRRVAYG